MHHDMDTLMISLDFRIPFQIHEVLLEVGMLKPPEFLKYFSHFFGLQLICDIIEASSSFVNCNGGSLYLMHP